MGKRTVVDDFGNEVSVEAPRTITLQDDFGNEVKVKARNATKGIRGMMEHAGDHWKESGIAGKGAQIAGTSAGVVLGAKGAHDMVEGFKDGSVGDVALGAVEAGTGVVAGAYANGFKPHNAVKNAFKNVKFRG